MARRTYGIVGTIVALFLLVGAVAAMALLLE